MTKFLGNNADSIYIKTARFLQDVLFYTALYGRDSIDTGRSRNRNFSKVGTGTVINS